MKRAALVLLLSLAACGDRQALTPRLGARLPPKPGTSSAQPTPDQLLATAAAERPGRSDDLLVRSQVRPEDTFDLPPQ